MTIKPIVPKRPLAESTALRTALEHEMDLWGKAVAARIKRYPAQVPGRKHTFRSDRERRGFFYHLRKGNIRVPYRRTRTLGRATTSETAASKARITTRVGVNLGMAPYAGYVVGATQTADMAARQWPQFDKVAKDEWAKTLPKLRSIFKFGK